MSVDGVARSGARGNIDEDHGGGIMSLRRGIQGSIRAALVMAFLGLAGCVEYTIETTLNEDGSGLREETMEVTNNDDLQMPETGFRELMFATEQHGWDHRIEVDAKGDTTRILERRQVVSDLSSWAGLSDKIRIRSSRRSQAGTTIGFLDLGNVQFRNTVEVGRTIRSGGATTFSFRESYIWDNGFDVIVEFLMERFDRELDLRYPSLTVFDRGGIVGFARAQFWAAVDQGLLEGEDDERLLQEIVDKTTEHAAKIILARDRRADPERVRAVLGEIVSGETDELEKLFEETLPGINLGFNTNVIFRLTMPGRVTDTNAHSERGSTLVWEFGPTDALAEAIEIFAESVVGG